MIEEDLDNQIVHFVDSSDEDNLPVRRTINKRGRGRPAHTAARKEKFEHKTNRRVDREIERNVKAIKGDADLAPWTQNAFTLPYTVYKRFSEAGYVLHFCPIDDAIIRSRENEGFVGVTLVEVPEWTVSAIPSMNASYGDIHKKFVVCIDQILMKIPMEKYQLLKKHVQSERNFNQRIVNRALSNSTNPAGLTQHDGFTLSRPG